MGKLYGHILLVVDKHNINLRIFQKILLGKSQLRSNDYRLIVCLFTGNDVSLHW